MNLRLNKAHFPVTTLGPGRRIGLWTQGCDLGCRGCCARDTWATDPGREVPIAAVLDWCRAVAPQGPEGITISGGEPFTQPEALAALLDGLREWRAELDHPFDILCYSGWPLGRLRETYPAILARLDVLIPEPFLDHRLAGGLWRGSDNQPLVLLSPLAEARYTKIPTDRPKRLQFAVDGEAIWCIGIPARGDLAAIEALCRARGLHLEDVSWRA